MSSCLSDPDKDFFLIRSLNAPFERSLINKMLMYRLELNKDIFCGMSHSIFQASVNFKP